MLFRTHVTFTIFVTLLIMHYYNVNNQLWFFSIAILTTAMVDIDTPLSKVGSKTKLLSLVTNVILNHRGVLHSITLPLTIYLILSVFGLSASVGVPFLVGYISHLILDAFTVRGIMPFFPIKKRINGFIKTGSLFETTLLVALILLIFLYFVFRNENITSIF